ncbi:hypothetical protein [Niabella aquatica]
MEAVWLVMVCVLLAGIAYMDFKERAVPVFLLAGLWLVMVMYGITAYGYKTTFSQCLTNSVMVGLVVGILFGYYALKERSLKQFVNKKLGTGDVVFWICIAPLFSPANFLLFFTGSLLLIIVLIGIQVLASSKTNLVPLAGYQSVLLLILLIVNYFFTKYDLSFNTIFLQ